MAKSNKTGKLGNDPKDPTVELEYQKFIEAVDERVKAMDVECIKKTGKSFLELSDDDADPSDSDLMMVMSLASAAAADVMKLAADYGFGDTVEADTLVEDRLKHYFVKEAEGKAKPVAEMAKDELLQLKTAVQNIQSTIRRMNFSGMREIGKLISPSPVNCEKYLDDIKKFIDEGRFNQFTIEDAIEDYANSLYPSSIQPIVNQKDNPAIVLDEAIASNTLTEGARNLIKETVTDLVFGDSSVVKRNAEMESRSGRGVVIGHIDGLPSLNGWFGKNNMTLHYNDVVDILCAVHDIMSSSDVARRYIRGYVTSGVLPLGVSGLLAGYYTKHARNYFNHGCKRFALNYLSTKIDGLLPGMK